MGSSRAGNNNCILWQKLSLLIWTLLSLISEKSTLLQAQAKEVRQGEMGAEKARSGQQPTPGDLVSIPLTATQALGGTVCRLKQARLVSLRPRPVKGAGIRGYADSKAEGGAT
jgi:hypothetical protein